MRKCAKRDIYLLIWDEGTAAALSFTSACGAALDTCTLSTTIAAVGTFSDNADAADSADALVISTIDGDGGAEGAEGALDEAAPDSRGSSLSFVAFLPLSMTGATAVVAAVLEFETACPCSASPSSVFASLGVAAAFFFFFVFGLFCLAPAPAAGPAPAHLQRWLRRELPRLQALAPKLESWPARAR